MSAQVAGFRLPLNAKGPVVMVAAGTGLAPMRGFLQHRAALKLEGQVGPMALVFGCRKEEDVLCRYAFTCLTVVSSWSPWTNAKPG